MSDKRKRAAKCVFPEEEGNTVLLVSTLRDTFH